MKAIPIKLHWASNGGPEKLPSTAGEEQRNSIKIEKKGPTSQRPWFRLPPKVPIVPGILGRAPAAETRIKHQFGGEPKVRDDGGSSHRPGDIAIPSRNQATHHIQTGVFPNLKLDPAAAHLNPSPPFQSSQIRRSPMERADQIVCICGAGRARTHDLCEDESRRWEEELRRIRLRWWRQPWLGW